MPLSIKMITIKKQMVISISFFHQDGEEGVEERVEEEFSEVVAVLHEAWVVLILMIVYLMKPVTVLILITSYTYI